ncbi:MAG: AAA family ATPase [Chloroflexi bacterium]|nr:AAA family ATPase [Chloroflexota bacterium]
MEIGKRIVVVGTSGSGKTTFARELATKLGYPHIELDAIHWLPNWHEAPLEIFRKRVAQLTARECWVLDGNYSKVRDLTWGRADTLVWLDYSLQLILWRLMRRTMRRIFLRQELWNGNRESLRGAFIGRDSLFAWAITSTPRHHRDYPRLLAQEYAQLRVMRFFSPRAASKWMKDAHAKQ